MHIGKAIYVLFVKKEIKEINFFFTENKKLRSLKKFIRNKIVILNQENYDYKQYNDPNLT